jgi:hypothetical protein
VRAWNVIHSLHLAELFQCFIVNTSKWLFRYHYKEFY